jgi:hypothetical protein
MTDTAAARRSREYRSYNFYRNFYEEHKDDDKKTERPRRRATLPWSEQPPVPFTAITGSTVLDAWSGRRIIEWICPDRSDRGYGL